MGLGALRALAMGQTFDAFSVPITVTRPFPADTPVITTGVWTKPIDEAAPYGHEMARREPPKVLAIQRTATLDVVPRGSVILAAETDDGTVLTWRSVGTDGMTSADLIRVVVERTT